MIALRVKRCVIIVIKTPQDVSRHLLGVIRDKAVNDRITEIFKGIPALYVADGHHRTAAAARVGQECASKNANHTGNIMPPKTTWFEPKLRSGVVIHSFEE